MHRALPDPLPGLPTHPEVALASAGIGESDMIGRCPVTVILYRKNKTPIYIYTSICYYVPGEDWELWQYSRQKTFLPEENISRFIIFNNFLYLNNWQLMQNAGGFKKIGLVLKIIRFLSPKTSRIESLSIHKIHITEVTTLWHKKFSL